MKRILALAVALAACACSVDPVPPPVGDAFYQTAVVCAPADLVETLSAGAELWHAAAARVDMHVVVGDGPECDVKASWEHLTAPSNAGTVPGAVFFDPSLRARDWTVEATHELGHLLLGHAHNPDAGSVMFWASGTTAITAADLERLP